MKYRTIVVDPPWCYRDKWIGGATGFPRMHSKRGAAANYPVMRLEDLEALPVEGWAEADAHLYLWVTNAFVEAGHQLARAWGFEQKTILTWVKNRVGLGHYFRNNTEHVLFCVRGSLRTSTVPLRTAFEWTQGRHSEKPGGFYDLVETVSPEPRLDVFARRHRFGWDAYGNEVYSIGEPSPRPWEGDAEPLA